MVLACALALACWQLAVSAAAAPPTPGAIDAASYGLLDAVACPSLSQCTALDADGGVLTFDPVSGGVVARGADDAPGETSLSCPSVSQCSVPSPARDLVTFDPTQPQAPTITDLWSLATNPQLEASVVRVACPSTDQCVANDAENGLYPFDPLSPAPLRIVATQPVGFSYVQLTCLSAIECVLLNNRGYELTINPQTATVIASARIYRTATQHEDLTGPIACPTATQCTTIFTAGAEVTFDPGAPASARSQTIDGGGANWAACPSATQCTAVDNDGGEVTFNPASPQGRRVIIDPNDGPLPAVACPSTTQCTLVDAAGNFVTFDPAAPSSASPYDAAAALTGLQPPPLGGPYRPSPRLTFELLAGDSAPADAIKAFTLILPRGLQFTASARSLRLGSTINTSGVRASYAARRTPQTLTVRLRHTANAVGVTIRLPAIAVVPGQLRSLTSPAIVNLYAKLHVTTTGGIATGLRLTLRQAPLDPGGPCPDADPQELYPITTSNPLAC